MVFINKHHLWCLSLALFTFCLPTQAAIIYVDAQVSGGDQSGTSWTNAYSSLHTALSNANSGDRIWVAQGTYLTSTTNDKSAYFELVDQVVLLGGFLPSHTSEGDRDFLSYPTILSADLNGDDGADFTNQTDNGYTVLYSENVSSSTIVDGFYIRGGNANGPSGDNLSPDRSGGAWYNVATTCSSESSPTIRNCVFENNQSAFYGGAIYNHAGSFVSCTSPTKTVNTIIENCTFTGNKAAEAGGAIYNDGSQTGSCNPRLSKCTFSQNEAGVAGGAVYNSGILGTSSPSFTGCQFTANEVPNNVISYAGAVYNFGNNGISEPSFINCQFNGNIAFAAGAMYNLGINGVASPLVLNCLFYGNIASQNAGALYANGGNTPTEGTSEPEVINCIFWNNTAGPFGGDVFRVNYGTINISYSLVDQADCNALEVGPGGTVNCGAGMQYNVNPLFEDINANNFNLQLASPAVDAGDANELTSRNINEDINCETRIRGTVDLGPYENQLGVLPLDLLVFRARYVTNRVVLNWETANEVQTSHFVIERSRNGQDWESLLEQNAKGATGLYQSYGDADRHPLSGRGYYRLRIEDLDGQYAYSQIVQVDSPFDQVTLYPNPVVDQIQVSIGDFRANEMYYQIFTQQGKLLYQGQAAIERGRTTFSLNTPKEWLPGTYFLRVYDEGVKSVTKPFLKIGL